MIQIYQKHSQNQPDIDLSVFLVSMQNHQVLAKKHFSIIKYLVTGIIYTI